MRRAVRGALAGALSAAVACADSTGPGSAVYCDLRPGTAVVEIEDPGLDLAIHAALGVAIGVPLTCDALRSLTTLNASSRGIATMAGIENLTALTTLNIRDNALTDIEPVRTMTGLTSLNLAANRLTDVAPLRNLTALTFLAINDNGGISDIGALAGLVNLRGTLWLGSNSIESLEPLRGLRLLTAVRAWDNRLADLTPLADLTALVEVNVPYNELSSVDGLGALPALRVVNLRDNPALSDIQDLIDNPVLVSGTDVNLARTGVSCGDVASLRAKGVAVISECD